MVQNTDRYVAVLVYTTTGMGTDMYKKKKRISGPNCDIPVFSKYLKILVKPFKVI